MGLQEGSELKEEMGAENDPHRDNNQFKYIIHFWDSP